MTKNNTMTNRNEIEGVLRTGKTRMVILRMSAPASLMLYSLLTYPRFGACAYHYDGQIMELLPTKPLNK